MRNSYTTFTIVTNCGNEVLIEVEYYIEKGDITYWYGVAEREEDYAVIESMWINKIDVTKRLDRLIPHLRYDLEHEIWTSRD